MVKSELGVVAEAWWLKPGGRSLVAGGRSLVAEAWWPKPGGRSRLGRASAHVNVCVCMCMSASHAGTQGSGVFECGVVVWWCGVVEGRAIRFDGVDVTDSGGVVGKAADLAGWGGGEVGVG